MRVIIAGAGEVGFNIARWLSRNGHSVTLIDRDAARIVRACELLDIQGVVGKCSVPRILGDAGAEEAEILVAVTDSDEVNMTACLIAGHRFGVPHKVARIREVGYSEVAEMLASEAVGIDLIIHPEMEVAGRLQRLIDFPAATDVLEFGDGTLRLAAFHIEAGSPLVGQPLERSFPPRAEARVLVCAVLRDDRVIIPHGADRLHADDQIYLLGRPGDLEARLPALGLAGPPITHVVIGGGSLVAQTVATNLEERGITVKIIEPDEQRCAVLSEDLAHTIVLHGELTDVDLMREENVGSCDLFLAVSDDEEDNMLTSMLARRLGARKVFCLLNRPEYVPLAPSLGIDAALNPRLSTVGAVLRFIRKGKVLAVDQLVEDQAEIMEAVAIGGSDLVGTPLAEVEFPKGAIVGAILHEGESRIAAGGDVVEEGDRVVIVAVKKAVKRVEKALQMKATAW